jgi:radical SAM protein with 4Fe4S-binding SPASM domain
MYAPWNADSSDTPLALRSPGSRGPGRSPERGLSSLNHRGDRPSHREEEGAHTSREQDAGGGDLSPVPVLRLVSWNMTLRCNLRCPHCYIDAGEDLQEGELSTAEGRDLIDQIVEAGRPILVLSGGEPLLREDVYELARYATDRGLRVVMGSNGTLITDAVAQRLRSSGIRAVAVSIDSPVPEHHDAFRGLPGAWDRAVQGIRACARQGIGIQVNTTVTPSNVQEIEGIFSLAGDLGARSFHLFFLVPTGRGAELGGLSASRYEALIGGVVDRIAAGEYRMEVRPVCAPQFTRIALSRGLGMGRWSRGCLAGLTYCRIYPNGDVTPCPYLPLRLGNIREDRFRDIWLHSPVLADLRDFSLLRGKCGRCGFRTVCGGCRARAYGMTGTGHGCGRPDEPGEMCGDYLAEDPMCPYMPGVDQG